MPDETARITIGNGYLPLFDAPVTEFTLIEGPRGTGKTRAVLSALLCYALQYPGARIMLARSTRTRLSQSVLVTLESQVFPAFGMAVPGGAGRDNRGEYKLPNTSVFVPAGLDDMQRSQSAEYAKIYVAEGVEIPQANDIVSLAGSLRQAGYPDKGVMVDCNPGAPGHWLNKIAEDVDESLRFVRTKAEYRRLLAHNRNRTVADGRWKRIITRHQDNVAYFDAATWEWTSDGAAYMRTLTNLAGWLRSRWLDGEWCAASGSVFPEFSRKLHVVKAFVPPADWPHFLWWDPGYFHPTSIGWLVVSPSGDIYVAQEIYKGGTSVETHLREIEKLNAGRTVRRYYGDPREFFSNRAQGPSCAVQVAKAGGPTFWRWEAAAGVEKNAQVNALRQLLINVRDDNGKPGLYFMDNCPNTISEMESWMFKHTAAGEIPDGDDAYEDANNHSIDGICGVLATGALQYELTPASEAENRPESY